MAGAKAEVKSVVFKNFDDEEFVCSWDSVPYRFPPGKEMYVEDWKAAHFAKHLVNKVMGKMGGKDGVIITNMVIREPLLRKALPDGISITQEEALDINAREAVAETKKTEETKEETKKKLGRPSKKVVEEEEFEGLKDNKTK